MIPPGRDPVRDPGSVSGSDPVSDSDPGADSDSDLDSVPDSAADPADSAASPPTAATALAHEAVLAFPFGSERRARTVARALRPETGEIDDDRARAAVDRGGATVRVTVSAADLVALRAGINSWSRLAAVAERVGDAAGSPGPDSDPDPDPPTGGDPDPGGGPDASG